MKMEIGKTYYCRSIGDHNCIFTLKVVGRTAKMATFIDTFGHLRRSKIYIDDRGYEYLMPDHYSFAPVFRADDTEKLERDYC